MRGEDDLCALQGQNSRILWQIIVVAGQDTAACAAQFEGVQSLAPAQVRADELVDLAVLRHKSLRRHRDVAIE